MPILVRHQPIAPALTAAAGVGQFSADRQITAENLRAAQFADEQQRAAAQLQLSASAQGFGQQQSNRDFDFRQQQADYQRGAQQEGFDIQRDQIGAGLERARIGAQADLAQTDLRGQQQYDLADLQGQYGLQRVGQQQAGADSRAADANDLRLVLAGMNIDSRTATAQERQMGLERLAAIRGQQQQDNTATLEAGRDYRFNAGLDAADNRLDKTIANRNDMFDRREAAASDNTAFRDWNANRLVLSGQMQRAEGEIGLLMQQARLKDRAGRPTTEAVDAAKQIPDLMKKLRDMQQAFSQVGAPPSQATSPAPTSFPANGGTGGNVAPSPQPAGTSIGVDPAQAAYGQQIGQATLLPDGSVIRSGILYRPTGRLHPDGSPDYQPVGPVQQ